MAKFDPPRIHRSSLTDRIYCITHGKVIRIEADGRELVEASVKYDVTDQIYALIMAGLPFQNEP